MEELRRIVRKLHLTSEELLLEADCVEDYQSYLNICLIGYSADMLRQAAREVENGSL